MVQAARVITRHGGYSDVAVLANGTILTLCEKPAAGGVCLARFNLAWLLMQVEQRPGK